MVARKTKTTQIEKAKGLDTPERFKLGAIGTSGLKIFDGVVETEMVSDLKYPYSNDTYEKMMLHPSI
ncbi:MAG: hypothetical protein ACRDBG_08865, partial [Waterburya sp.]